MLNHENEVFGGILQILAQQIVLLTTVKQNEQNKLFSSAVKMTSFTLRDIVYCMMIMKRCVLHFELDNKQIGSFFMEQ